MIITRKAIPRRTVLRGLGTTLALPLLDSMVPALTALEKTPARPTRRFGVVYLPNGMVMKNWTPAADGTAFEMTPIMTPLSAFRDRMVVLSGLDNSDVTVGSHETGSTKFLTGMPPKPTQGGDLQAGISIDQMVAKVFGQETQVASLELGIDVGQFGGTCGLGFSCAYTNTISWRGPSTPLPMEANPRVVFERLLGDGGSTDPAARLARIRKERSVLDAVTDKLARLQRQVGGRDRVKLGEYLDSLRDVERRVHQAEAQSGRELPAIAQPAGIPATYEEHAKLMFDLQVLAYQTDLTRVITFMMGPEFCGRTYQELGISEGHHPLSHHQDLPDKLTKLTKIQTYHMSLFSYYLEKLRSVPDGDATLLDQMLIIYGAGLSNSNTHVLVDLPVLLVGGAAGHLKGGRHLRFANNTPFPNLHLSVMEHLGLPMDKLGNSNAALSGIFS